MEEDQAARVRVDQKGLKRACIDPGFDSHAIIQEIGRG